MTTKTFFVDLTDAQKHRLLAQFPEAHPGDGHLYESVAPQLDVCGQPPRRWIVSHRRNETPEHYERRLARARLRRSDIREIEEFYARLDAERTMQALPPAERVAWTPADILEWSDLNARERYADLKNYAKACDRVTGIRQGPMHAAA